jgi:beta-1,4-mannosyltransferase
MVRVLSIPGRSHGNRYFELLAQALEQRGVQVVEPAPRQTAAFAYDVLHLNFPTHYITENGAAKAAVLSVVLGAYLIMARLLGRRIVYTVHDVVPFRSRHPFLQKHFLRLTHRLTDAFVFLSASSREAFVTHYPEHTNSPWVSAPHGPYPVSLLSEDERARRRQEVLGSEDAFVVGFLGDIKPYKNIDALRALPDRLADGRAVRILVAGRVERGYEEAAQAVLASLPSAQVVRLDKYLSDTEFDELIQIVDVVLVPYVKGSNSGVAMLVLSNEARLIGSGLPVFRELATTVGAPWAASFGSGQQPLAEVVEASARRTVTESDRTKLRTYLAQVSYAESARVIGDLYERLVNKTV